MSLSEAALRVLPAALVLILAGCTAAPQDPGLQARANDPAGLVSGIPARGENVCLAAAPGLSGDVAIAVRGALSDRGYETRFLLPGEQPSAKACRFLVTVSGAALRMPGTLPRYLAVDYRDLFTGEAQRAEWTREGDGTSRPGGSAFLRPDAAAAGNPLAPGAWGNLDWIVGKLVDRLFPMTVRGR